jgi:hypothetical protein
MDCSMLEQEGLSNLVEAATALATFSLCSRLPTKSPDQAKNTLSVSPFTTFFNPQSNVETHVSDNPNTILAVESNKETFPQRLLAILNDKDVSPDVISWLPNGRSFIIARPDIFMETILPKYIAPESNRSTIGSTASPTTISTKYPSFTRKLNRW